MTTVAWSLVGRVAELEFVAGQLANRSNGGVVLAGELGVGKTRLAKEALSRIPRDRASTAWVVATRAAASVPFGAIVSLLPRPQPNDIDETGGIEFYQRVTAAVANRTKGHPLVVGIDDAHLLDSGSAALIHQLVSGGTIQVICTVRSNETMPDAIVALWKDELVARLEVQALSLAETTELVETALGGLVDSDTMGRLWESSRGNPLLIRELVMHARESGELHFNAGTWHSEWPISDSIWLKQIVGEQLDDASVKERQVLELLAVGEPLNWSLLDHVASSSAMTQLSKRGLVVVTAEGKRRHVRLTRPFYGEVIRANLGPLGEDERRGELAKALMDFGLRREGDELRVATLAVDHPGIELDPGLLTRAAVAANARWAWDLAERFAKSALDGGAGPVALWALVIALWHLGRGAEANRALTRLSREPIDKKQQGMLFALQAAISDEAGGSWDAQQVVEEALASISDRASQDFVRAQWATILSAAGRDAEATEIAVPLVTNAKTDDLARLRAMATAVYGWNRQGRVNTSLEQLRKALPIAFARLDDLPDAVYWLGGTLVLTEITAGHLDAADSLLTMSAEMAAGGRGFDPKQLANLTRGRIAMLRGDVKGAVRLLASVASAPRSLVVEERAWAWALLAEAKAVLGDVTGAEEALGMADSCMESSSSRYRGDIRRCHLWVAAASGELSRAADLAREAAAWADQTEDRFIELWYWHELARLGAPGEAVAPLGRLASQVDGDWSAAFRIHVDALVAGDGPGLMVAADRFERIGARLHAAEAASEAASLFRQHGLRAQFSAAAARAAALAAGCGGAHTPALKLVAAGPTLSRREREVALMASRGLSSSKIAMQLDISRRTVEGHLQRAYEKLGVTSRSELAAVMHVQDNAPDRRRG